MTPFDLTQAPAMLQNILALSGGDQSGAPQAPPQGAATPQGPTPLQNVQEVGDKARDDYFKKNKDLDTSRKLYQDVADKLNNLTPTTSNYDKIQQRLSEMLDENSPYNQQYKDSVAKLQSQLSQLPSIPAQLRDRDKYINQRIEQVYGGKFDDQGNLVGRSKIGMAAQFLQDILRAKGAPSGRQAAYEMAGKEYDQAVKDNLEQQQAQRQSAQSQIQLLGSQRTNEAMQLNAQGQAARTDLAAQRLNLDRLTRGANVILSGMKLEDAAKNEDVKNMLSAFDAQYGKTAPEQRLQQMIQDFMGHGMSESAAKVQASSIMSLVDGLKRVPAMMGSTTVTSEIPAHNDAQGNVVPGSSTSRRMPTGQLPNILQMIQQMQGPQSPMLPGSPLAPQVPSQPTGQPQAQPPQQPAQAPTQAPFVGPRQAPVQLRGTPTPDGQDSWDPVQHKYKFADGTMPSSDGIRLGMLQMVPPGSSGMSGGFSRGGQGYINKQNRDAAAKVWDNYDKWVSSINPGRTKWTPELGDKPAWTDKLASEKAAAETAFDKSAMNGPIKAQSTAIEHIGMLNEALKGLGNDPNRLMNWINTSYKKNFEDNSNVTNFEMIADRVGDEIANAYVSGGGALGDRERIKDQLSRSAGPQQLADNLRNQLRLFGSLINSTQVGYDKATSGLGAKKVLTPQAQQVITQLTGGSAPSPALQKMLDKLNLSKQ